MIVSTLKADSLKQLQNRLKVASKPQTLIFAFASQDIDHFSLYELLNQKGYIPITVSSGGQFINGEHLLSGISCMVLDLPQGSFKVKRYDYADDFFDAGKSLGQYAYSAYQNADALVFINTSPLIDHEAIVSGFQHGANNEVPVFGSVASYDQTMVDSFIGANGVVSKQSIGMVVFDKSKVSLQGLIVCGWEPIGTYKTVTKSLGKKIYELDGLPVKQVYKEYFSLEDGSPLNQYLEFPIQISRANGDTVFRTVSSIEEDGFCYSGDIKEGAKVYFCSPSITKAVGGSINEISAYQKSNNLMDSDAVLAFSCCARLEYFGFYIQNELRSFNEMWGEKHTGFFSHGEIGSYRKGESTLHNNSLSIVFIKDLTSSDNRLAQSNNIQYKEQKIAVADALDKDHTIVKLQEQKQVLSNLLQRTSLDLNNALQQLDHYKNDLEQKVEEQLTDIKKLNTEVIDTQREVVFTLGSIAETRSKETGNHVNRVAEYSKVFALHLGLGEEIAELIKQASPMHDIGKVGIPDAILNKPGPLNQAEFTQMKTHADLGYKMLQHSERPILQVAATIAREHHERWDGSGYPRGLVGKQIHLYGRITALADVFDALGSERCYKKAWTDQRILAHFKDQRGKHFDPELVDIFFEHLAVFKAIREKYSDR